MFQGRLELADGLARVAPVGEIDIETAPIVNERLEDVRAVGFGRVVLDLSHTTFIDSAGLHVAVEWHERARREDFTFGLTRGPYVVQRTFDTAGLGAVLNFVAAP